jgi:hypothetical protein
MLYALAAAMIVEDGGESPPPRLWTVQAVMTRYGAKHQELKMGEGYG